MTKIDGIKEKAVSIRGRAIYSTENLKWNKNFFADCSGTYLKKTKNYIRVNLITLRIASVLLRSVKN